MAAQAARALEQGAGDVNALLRDLDWDVLRAAKAKAESKAKMMASAKEKCQHFLIIPICKID